MINRMILQGRLTAAPELKQTQSGVPFISFTVGWNEKYKEIETKCFQRCTAWRDKAEFLSKYFVKGQELIVSGKMITREWEDNGQKRSVNELAVDEIQFCGSKAQNQNATHTPQSEAAVPLPAPQFEVISSDDELPF